LVFAYAATEEGGWPSFDFFYSGTTFGCPSFRSFRKLGATNLSFWGCFPRLGSVGREKIDGANASGAQLSNGRKAGAASVSMVTAKLGQPPANDQAEITIMTGRVDYAITRSFVDDYIKDARAIASPFGLERYVLEYSELLNQQDRPGAIQQLLPNLVIAFESIAIDSVASGVIASSLGYFSSLGIVGAVVGKELKQIISRLSAREHAESVATWHNLVIIEIHEALCVRSRRYKAAVAELAHNAKLLIAAIAGYLAAVFGVATAIIAALVAATLRLVLAMGMSVFCQKFKIEVLKLQPKQRSLRAVKKAVKKLKKGSRKNN
jgi:hypothetical protein